MTRPETVLPTTTRQLALRRSERTLIRMETPLLGPARSRIMTTPETPLATSTALSAAVRSLLTLTDSATTLLATQRFSSIQSPLKTPPLVMLRSRLMTRADSVLPTTTWQLAVRRSSITLMAARTQPWAQGQDQT